MVDQSMLYTNIFYSKLMQSHFPTHISLNRDPSMREEIYEKTYRNYMEDKERPLYQPYDAVPKAKEVRIVMSPVACVLIILLNLPSP